MDHSNRCLKDGGILKRVVEKEEQTGQPADLDEVKGTPSTTPERYNHHCHRSTSGIGLEIARQLAEAGAHVVMAVRNTDSAHKLVQKWQQELKKNFPWEVLNIDAMELDLGSFKSVARFANAWNQSLIWQA
ncbi:hypothetical protein L1987_24048 [Smallanthus sonchifolius]|uniref:Uncharacterized protein n=1 Tax=Smallanthus sonchifolius TaxID=185202 RepID=A0ACB9IKU7_9ASTR|nr:hypothetical protein L1987_24048 [Smallanthus sonchifolius]